MPDDNTSREARERLLPCPFCGSDNLRVCACGIECRNCGVWMGDGTQCRTIGETVLDAWNHRATRPETCNEWGAKKKLKNLFAPT